MLLCMCKGFVEAKPQTPSAVASSSTASASESAVAVADAGPPLVQDAQPVAMDAEVDAAPEPPPKPKLEIVKECTVPGAPEEGKVDQALDVEWGPIMGQSLALDIAWPIDSKAGTTHPLIVIIHGGGWTAGDKKMFRETIRMLAGQGYVAATVNYRLANVTKNVFPAGIEDTRCVVRWLRANAAKFHIDPSRVGALGASAGGHLSAMLATADDHIGFDATCPIKDQPVKITSAVSYYAPLDLRDVQKRYVAKMQQAVEEFLGGKSEDVPKRASLGSPVTHLDSNDAPMLLLHAIDDQIVPVEDSRDFKKALDKANVPSLYVEVSAGKHGFPIFGKDPKFRASTCTTLAFLRATLHP